MDGEVETEPRSPRAGLPRALLFLMGVSYENLMSVVLQQENVLLKSDAVSEIMCNKCSLAW